MIKVTGADLCNAIDYRVARLKLALNAAIEDRNMDLAELLLCQIGVATEARKAVSGAVQAKILYDVEVKEGDRLRDELA